MSGVPGVDFPIASPTVLAVLGLLIALAVAGSLVYFQ